MSTSPVVIIADRDQLVSSALRVEFSHRDFVVLLANSAAEAESFAAQTVAALVLLDVGTLQVPGFEACARIHRSEGYAARPIVLTAAKSSPQLSRAARAAGAVALLEKPYSFSGLVDAVLPHVPAHDPVSRSLGVSRSPAKAPQQEWIRSSALNWRFGNDSRLSGNARLMPVVRAAGMKVPLVKVT